MRLRRIFKICLISICLGAFLVACQNTIFKEALTLSPESLKDRQLQTRIFEAKDEKKLLTASAAVLQDLGFNIDETEVRCGVIVCSRDRDVTVTAEVVLSVALEILSILVLSPTSVPYDKTQKVLSSLVTTPVDNQRVAVRITFHHLLLRTIIATFQDLGFVIDDAEESLGTVSGTKRSGYFLRMTVSIRPRGTRQMIVRSNVQYNLETIEEPEPYQYFFSTLSKALFLEAQPIK